MSAMSGLPICTHCGYTWGEYRARGLVGCPHCYAAFGDALRGDLLWIHQTPGPPVADDEDPSVRAERVAHLREGLADALRKEDYAEASRLRRALDRENPPGARPDPGDLTRGTVRDGDPAAGTGS